MKRVVIEELTTGMILAKPVTNNAGLVVLPVGAELDEATLSRLQRLGLTSVYVEGESGDASGKTLYVLDSRGRDTVALTTADLKTAAPKPVAAAPAAAQDWM